MEENRTTTIILGVVLLLSLCFLYLISIVFGGTPVTFYWGIPIGAIFGIATWFYLAKTWDPVNRRPIDPDKRADWRILWAVPLGIIIARILPWFVGEEISSLIIGAGLSWGMFTLGYGIFQVWRYRPK